MTEIEVTVGSLSKNLTTWWPRETAASDDKNIAELGREWS